jgi:hypothetical protein
VLLCYLVVDVAWSNFGKRKREEKKQCKQEKKGKQNEKTIPGRTQFDSVEEIRCLPLVLSYNIKQRKEGERRVGKRTKRGMSKKRQSKGTEGQTDRGT